MPEITIESILAATEAAPARHDNTGLRDPEYRKYWPIVQKIYTETDRPLSVIIRAIQEQGGLKTKTYRAAYTAYYEQLPHRRQKKSN